MHSRRGWASLRKMTVAERQAHLQRQFGPITDPHERLMLIVRRRAPVPPVAEKTDSTRVHGCQTPVWVDLAIAEGRCAWHLSVEGPLVAGLAGLLVECLQGVPLAEAATAELTILDDLRLFATLSPTRQQGLTALACRLRELAQANSHLTDA